MKSSLTRKRVLKDPKFQLTRVHASLLGEAAKIASRVYRLITGERKKHTLYREITGKAIYMLREGKDKEEAFEILRESYLKPEPVAPDLQRNEVIKGGKPCRKVRVNVGAPALNTAFIDKNTFLRAERRRRGHYMIEVSREKQAKLGHERRFYLNGRSNSHPFQYKNDT
ncbi:MAG: hypothetical protein EPN39_14080 [Chitinophagaceae bacterium]|nr:MAG: hypothetical protein EPN39_14080 [Chitinophagaceae bacterium]